MAKAEPRDPLPSSGFLPGQHAIEGYGAGGFRFGDMSHRGSILALPSGIYAWDVSTPDDLTAEAFERVFAEVRSGGHGPIDLLLIGTGEALRNAGIPCDPMATAAAARTYSILLGEKRRVAAALLAVA